MGSISAPCAHSDYCICIRIYHLFIFCISQLVPLLLPNNTCLIKSRSHLHQLSLQCCPSPFLQHRCIIHARGSKLPHICMRAHCVDEGASLLALLSQQRGGSPQVSFPRLSDVSSPADRLFAVGGGGVEGVEGVEGGGGRD